MKVKQSKSIARSNLLLCMGFSFFFASLVALGNLIVDPYRIFARDIMLERKIEKPRPEQYQRQIRTELAKKMPSENLIMGNSTLEIGIDPDDPTLNVLGTIFNHAIAGNTIGEMHRALNPLLASFKPKRIIVNLAFSDYVMSGTKTEKERGVAASVNLIFRSLFSVDSSIASLETITLPYRKFPQTLSAAGHNPMRDYQGHAQTSGYGVLFTTANARIESVLIKYENGRGLASLETSMAMHQVDVFIERLKEENINVLFVMPPLHSNYINNLYNHGLGSAYEHWKNHLTKKIMSLNRPNQFKILDFGCESAATLEPIPKIGDRKTTMRFFWDPEHFKSTLGAEIFHLAVADNIGARRSSKNLTVSELTSVDLQQHHKNCRDFHLKK
jgi:hypothetical protein